jgi:hypothetical protein
MRNLMLGSGQLLNFGQVPITFTGATPPDVAMNRAWRQTLTSLPERMRLQEISGGTLQRLDHSPAISFQALPREAVDRAIEAPRRIEAAVKALESTLSDDRLTDGQALELQALHALQRLRPSELAMQEPDSTVRANVETAIEALKEIKANSRGWDERSREADALVVLEELRERKIIGPPDPPDGLQISI